MALLERFGCLEDVLRVQKGKNVRSGRSKIRGNRYRIKKGPLFVVDDDSKSLVRALKNI